MSPRHASKQRKIVQNSVNYVQNNSVNYHPLKMDPSESRDALSALNGGSCSSNKQTASQSAISASTLANYAFNKRRLKKDYISRIAMVNARNTDTFLSQADISNLDVDVPNAEVFLATSKPSSTASSKKEISSPSMKAYMTKAWAEGPPSAA